MPAPTGKPANYGKPAVPKTPVAAGTALQAKTGFFRSLMARFSAGKKTNTANLQMLAEAKKAVAKKQEARQSIEERRRAEQQAAQNGIMQKAAEEKNRVALMAQKAAQSNSFARICADAGWKDPQQAFLHYYEALQKNPKIATMEFDAMMDARSKGEKTFSRTRFYMQLIANHLAKPKKQ